MYNQIGTFLIQFKEICALFSRQGMPHVLQFPSYLMAHPGCSKSCAATNYCIIKATLNATTQNRAFLLVQNAFIH